MAPKLRPGQLVMATPLFRRLHPGQVIIFRKNDREQIKRIEKIRDDHVFVIGDNLEASTDSRQFGWVDQGEIIARVFRPNLAK
jgi:hypothetical protein